MGNKIIVPFGDKEGGIYELSVDLDRLSKGEMLNAIIGIGCTKEQSTFVSKTNKAKKLGEVPFPSRDVRENRINYGKGLDHIYGTKPVSDQAEDLNPFASNLQKIKPSADESEKLSWFKSAVVEAKNINELHKTIEQVLAAGARLNAYNDGEWSIAEYVVLGTHFHRLEKPDRKKLIRKLMLSGAEFHDTLLQNKLIGEIYNELQPEVQPQIDKQLEELEEAGESAVQEGELIDIEIDNTTSYIEFSKDSKVEVAKILEANGELGSNILKIGNDAVEVKSEKGGARNYTGLSDGSSVTLEFPTSIGKLNIILYHDVKHYDQVQVKVANKEIWAELQQRGEKIGKNCLFGGMTVKEAVAAIRDPSQPLRRKNPESTSNLSTMLLKTRIKNEMERGKLLEAKAKAEIGELVAVEEVKREAFNVARVVRNNLLNIPNRVSALLASLSDTEKIHMALTEEITNSLEELSNTKFQI